MQGFILPGVTRSAVLELAKARGYTTEETDVPITQALEVRMFSCVLVKVCRLFGPRAPYYDAPPRAMWEEDVPLSP